MTSLVVRERGSNKFAKVLTFAYKVPSGVRGSLNTWIAVPKINVKSERALVADCKVKSDETAVMGALVEVYIKERCKALTIGQ